MWWCIGPYHTWTPPNTFKLVQLGPHCTETPTPPTCSNFFVFDKLRHLSHCSLLIFFIDSNVRWHKFALECSNLFKFVQRGPHCTGTPPLNKSCSNLFIMKDVQLAIGWLASYWVWLSLTPNMSFLSRFYHKGILRKLKANDFVYLEAYLINQIK